MDRDGDDETDVLIVHPQGHGYASINSYGVTDEDSEADGERNSVTIDEAIEMTGFGRFHIGMLIVLGLAQISDALQSLSVSYILPQASCEFEATDLELSLVTVMGFAGMMFGAYLWGAVSDTKGRVTALILAQAFNSVFAVGSALSQSLWFLILTRFFNGFGLGGSLTLVYIYVVELLPAKLRGRLLALLGFHYSVGMLVVAGLAWLIIPHSEWSWATNSGFAFNSWRLFLLSTAVPSICLNFLTPLVLRESPRFLVQSNRMSKAKEVIKYIYEKNRNEKPFENNLTIQRNQTASSLNNSGVWNVIKKVARNTWDLVALPELRINFAVSSIILFSLAFSFFGLSMWFPTLIERMDATNATSVCSAPPGVNKTYCDNSDQTPVYVDTFLQAAANVPGHVIYMLLINLVGGKLLIGVTMIASALSVFFLWFVSSSTESIVMSCLFNGISVIAWNTIALVQAEVFPTKIRSTAMGLQVAVFNRVSAIMANIAMGALISTHCTVAILLIAGLLAIGGIVAYKLPSKANAAIS